MSEKSRDLRLVSSQRLQRPRIEIAPYFRPPFPIQALILEEDTWFALSTPTEIREPRVHPIRTMTEAWEAEPVTPGSVHVRDGYPLRILAVVHDLSQDPTWHVDWIETALRGSLEEAHRRGLGALGVEPLGAVHGRFPADEFDRLLERVLREIPAPPAALWRIEPEIPTRR